MLAVYLKRSGIGNRKLGVEVRQGVSKQRDRVLGTYRLTQIFPRVIDEALFLVPDRPCARLQCG